MTATRTDTFQSPEGSREIRFAMGTVVTIYLPQNPSAMGASLLKGAFGEIERIERLLSVFRSGSDIWQLNHTGCCQGASTETLEVIKRARHFSELSGGAFDITAGAMGPGRIIDNTENSGIRIENDTIRLAENWKKVNLGAIAKGYIVDRAIAWLANHGVESAMVNAGGDLRAIGNIQKGLRWRVGIRNPFKRRKMVSEIKLSGQAVATSGSYQRTNNDIYDPRTQEESKTVISASVVMDTAMDADALATSVFVLGPGEGKMLIETATKGAALWVLANGSIIQTARWKDYQ